MYSTIFHRILPWPFYCMLSLFLLVLFQGENQAQVSVVPASDSILSLKKQGILYCLPQAQLTIHLQQNKTSHTRGAYAANAKEMLGLENVRTEDQLEYSLDVSGICNDPIPDPAHYYLATLKKPLCKPAPVLSLSPESFLLSLNKKTESLVEEKMIVESRGPEVKKIRSLDQFNYHINADLFKTIAADTSPFPKYIFRVKTTDDPIIKKARNAVENLARIKENKTNLLSGYQEIAYDKNTMEIMLKGLEAEEEKTLSLFTGNTEIVTSEISLPLLPEPGDTLPVVIGHFSKKEGFAVTNINGGDPVTITFTALRDYAGIKSPKSKKPASVRQKGLVIREPGWVKAEIRIGDNLVYTQIICLPQLGRTLVLPSKTRQAIFDTRNGAVLTIQ